MQSDIDDDTPHPGGRPTKYKPEFAKQAVPLCEHGFTDQELADFFEVNIATLYRWKAAHPEFRDAIKNAGEIADDRVERSLYQKAIGYEQDAVKVFMPAGASDPVYAPIRERVAADTTAAIFWLKNRRKEQWRDTSRQEQTGPDGGPVKQEVNHIGLDEFARRIAGIAARTTEAGGDEPADGSATG